MKTCYLCRGQLERRRVEVTCRHKGKLIIVEDVPAEVCTQCGEQYFDPQTSLALDRILDAQTFPGERVTPVPVRRFSPA